MLVYVPWLRVNLDKTEVLWVGQQNKDPDIRREEKKLTQRDTARHSETAMYVPRWSGLRDCSTETGIRRIIQSGANAWRNVEEVMGNISFYRNLK